MTVMNYGLLQSAIAEIQHKYNAEQWREIADHWWGQSYLSPNQGQLALFVVRQVLKDKRPVPEVFNVES